MQGKIMEALLALSEDPITPKGNTLKPLTGDLKHYWRMRLGDFRIVYYPDLKTGDITLIDFAARSSIYD
jgi:mRNA-degrading endonuclease RelE of RelBE toxin-antitoxin system